MQGFSPDKKWLLYSVRENEFTKFTLLELSSEQSIQVPLLYGQFFRWSMDSNQMFFSRAQNAEYNAKTQFYRYSIDSNRVAEWGGSMKWPSELSYSESNNSFLLEIKNKIYMVEGGTNSKPELVLKDAHSPFWFSSNGLFCYQSTRDSHLYVYDIKSKSSVQLTNGSAPTKKN